MNKTVAELEALPRDVRVFIVRIRRRGEIIEASPTSVIHQDDVVAVLARQEVHVERGDRIGPEVDDKSLARHPDRNTGRGGHEPPLVGKTLAEWHGSRFARGVFLRKLTRAGQEIPIAAETRIDRGDVVRLIGTKPEVERAAKELGYPDRPTTATDMVFVGTGIVLGGFVGLLSVTVARHSADTHRQRRRADHGAGVRLAAVGVSVFRAHPRAGDLDLRYRRIVRLHRRGRPERGPQLRCRAAENRHQPGLRGPGIALLPHTVGILFGRYVLKMNPLIVLGACAGAGTITAALRAIQDEARSSVPALGYTVPYAIGNILLTAWGPVLVAMMAAGR